MGFAPRHLLGLEGMPADGIVAMLDSAASFKEISERDIKKVPTLRGKTVINLFYENSTRTRTSFEIAAKRLSADTVTSRLDARAPARARRSSTRRGTSRRCGPTRSSSATRCPARRSSSRGTWPARSSTPATAATSIRPRRCSTC